MLQPIIIPTHFINLYNNTLICIAVFAIIAVIAVIAMIAMISARNNDEAIENLKTGLKV
jgi:hypothetical protein